MSQTFSIFTDEWKLCDFINGMAKRGKKFNITPWSNQENTEKGFVVWYFQ